MKRFVVVLFSLSLIFCSPKGPQTFDSPFIGKTKSDLISSKGIAKEIQIFDESEAHIYKVREEYFGNKVSLKDISKSTPKKVIEIEHIYYINNDGLIYKYQVWKKRVD